MNKNTRLEITYATGKTPEFFLNGVQVIPYHNDMYRLKWSMVKAGARRVVDYDTHGETISFQQDKTPAGNY